MNPKLYTKIILSTSFIGATIGTGISTNSVKNLDKPTLGDIFLYPVSGLSLGASVGLFMGICPPLIPVCSYLTYHHRKTLFPAYFANNTTLRHP